MHAAPFSAPWFIQVLVSLFLAILFLQSGLDKVINWGQNLDWLTAHFEKTPLRRTVPPMFLAITVLENTAGALSAIGCVMVLLLRNSTVAYLGAVVAGVAIVALFFGQRVGKDYDGAATLVPYFLLTILAIWVLRIDPLVSL